MAGAVGGGGGGNEADAVVEAIGAICIHEAALGTAGAAGNWCPSASC